MKGVVLADSVKSALTSFFLPFNSRVCMTKCSILFVVFMIYFSCFFSQKLFLGQ